MSKYKKIRSKLCIFISFFISFIITLIFLSTGVLLGGLNRNVIMNDLKKSNYYQKNYEAFIEQAKLIGNEFGLSEDVITESLTIANYHIKANNYFSYASKNADVKVVELAIDMELDNVVRQWSAIREEKYGNVTLEESMEMEQCAKEIANVYQDSIEFPYAHDIARYQETFLNFFKIALPVGLLLIAVLIFTLFVSNKYKHRAVRYVIYAVLGADIVTFVVGIYLLKIKGQLIPINHDRYQAFLDLYYRDSVVPFFLILCAGILLAVILLLMVHQMRNQLIAKNKND